MTFEYGLEGNEGVSHADICFSGRVQYRRMLFMFQEQEKPTHVIEAGVRRRGGVERETERETETDGRTERLWDFPCK